MYLANVFFFVGFRSDVEKLKSTPDLTTSDISRFILSYCSRSHLIEMTASKACRSPFTGSSIHSLNMRISELRRALEILNESCVQYGIPGLEASLAIAQDHLRILKKLYRTLYMQSSKRRCFKRVQKITRILSSDITTTRNGQSLLDICYQVGN